MTLLCWEPLQEAMFAALTAALAGTAAEGKIGSYIQEDSQPPYVLIGEFNTTPYGSKTSHAQRTNATVTVYSLNQSSEEVQRLSAIIHSVFVTQELSGSKFRAGGPAVLETADLRKETDSVNVRWAANLVYTFITQPIF